ncbi:MAG: PA0069 family radical SAM protein [Sphingomonadales bacterium]
MRLVDGNWDLKGTMVPSGARRGRAAVSNSTGRFEAEKRSGFDDGWGVKGETDRVFKTQVFKEVPRKIITTNKSPDIPFDRSINPYRGCEHGCIYCFARPSHAYLGYSPGLDFETKLFYKPDAAILLERELRNKHYKCAPIAIGTNTDPYQPIERSRRVMQSILQVLSDFHHPLTIVTKSALILRDIEILKSLAQRNLVHVSLSVTSLDHKLARRMEPRAATPKRRLAVLKTLSEAGIPTGVMVAPIIPTLNDHEIEDILIASKKAGVTSAVFIFMRLPLEIKDLFEEWLEENYPDRKSRVLNHLRSIKGGRLNNPNFFDRFKGQGPYAEIVRERFHGTCRRLGLSNREDGLDCTRFNPPPLKGEQMDLFTG